MSGAARGYFPRGLVQPEAGYRFSLDALLLACFSPAPAGARLLDLGCGCGVVGLGMVLRQPDMHLTGVDVNPEMVQAAGENAGRLGLGEQCAFFEHDVAQLREKGSAVSAETYSVVVANPPYRSPQAGRASPYAGRQEARFAPGAALETFVAAAAYALANRGRFACVFLAERLPYLCAVLRQHRLEPKRMRFVHSRAQRPAKQILVEARKNSGEQLHVEPPLVLYGAEGLRAEAVTFCPYLGCNA
ncbi:MAG: tRNA1(Val) (adenine(37)-N6)-methyltransferase [Thermodesulfobacteriota bacterium]